MLFFEKVFDLFWTEKCHIKKKKRWSSFQKRVHVWLPSSYTSPPILSFNTFQSVQIVSIRVCNANASILLSFTCHPCFVVTFVVKMYRYSIQHGNRSYFIYHLFIYHNNTLPINISRLQYRSVTWRYRPVVRTADSESVGTLKENLKKVQSKTLHLT